MSVFTSYSMDFSAYLRAVRRYEEKGKYPNITDLKNREEEAYKRLNQAPSGDQKEQVYQAWILAQNLLWQAQMQEAERLFVADVEKMKQNN